MYFSFLIPSSKSSHILSLLSNSQIHFSFIIFMCIYAFVCTYVFLNITCLVNIMILFQGQPIGTANRCSVPWGEPHFHSQFYFIPCSSLSRIEGSWTFPNSVCHNCWYYSYLVHVFRVTLVRFYEHSFWWSSTFYNEKCMRFGGIEEGGRDESRNELRFDQSTLFSYLTFTK